MINANVLVDGGGCVFSPLSGIGLLKPVDTKTQFDEQFKKVSFKT